MCKFTASQTTTHRFNPRVPAKNKLIPINVSYKRKKKKGRKLEKRKTFAKTKRKNKVGVETRAKEIFQLIYIM